MSAISLQTGIREYHGDLSQYTGMLGGLTPDIHTLRSLNPLTTNRVIAVMYRGPYFLMHYFGGEEQNAYNPKNEFGQYKKIIEAYNTGITCNIGDAGLAPATLQGGFAGRSISIPTTQNQQSGQTLQIQVPEMVGRPMANFHNMWVDGIADPITGLTTYHGLVAGSVDDSLVPQRIFAPSTGAGANAIALEPSPAWEVAEFLVIVLDRSGARVEAATMALGCVPSGKVGNNIFNSNATGQSQIASIDLNFTCQFIQSAYVNDLASRYVEQFAIFGNSINLNPGAGDAFFDPNGPTPSNGGTINTPIFNHGERPYLDAVQSGLGNAPVMTAGKRRVDRVAPATHALEKEDHSKLYINEKMDSKSIANPYESTATPNS
jgi:hypothetical protein